MSYLFNSTQYNGIDSVKSSITAVHHHNGKVKISTAPNGVIQKQLIRRHLVTTKAIAKAVGSLRILGVTIASDLSVLAHVDALLNAGARSIYALCLLRAHRLPDHALKIVTRAATTNRILNAGPAWWGYAVYASDKGRIQRFLDRMYESGFLTEQDTDIEHQITAANDNLLRAVVRNERHVLRHLFPSEKQLYSTFKRR